MHHGGQLQFGPSGLLYVSTGIGDEPRSSQDPGDPRGKILRFDPLAVDRRPEVVALGLRNPWRFSFDRRTGRLLIGDVGGSAQEEIDVLDPAGPLPVNFGWPFAEGRRAQPGAPAGLTAPAIAHAHGPRWCSIVGGYAVRAGGPRSLRGRYLYGDVCSGALWSARIDGAALGRPRRLGLHACPTSSPSARTPAGGSTPSASTGRSGGSGRELDGDHVAVGHHVVAALEAQRAAVARAGVAAGLDERVPADHLGAHEALLDVGVDLAGGVPRGQAARAGATTAPACPRRR